GAHQGVVDVAGGAVERRDRLLHVYGRRVAEQALLEDAALLGLLDGVFRPGDQAGLVFGVVATVAAAVATATGREEGGGNDASASDGEAAATADAVVKDFGPVVARQCDEFLLL